MSRFRKIDVRMWNDRKYRSLADDGKMVFVLVLTHPAQTALGAMRASVDGLARELKWLPERFRKGLAELVSNGMVEVDEEADLIALPNFLKYNSADNPNVVKAWASCLDMLPECELKNLTIQRAWLSLQDRPDSMKDAFKQAFKGLPYGLSNGTGNSMPNHEKEKDKDKDKDIEKEKDSYFALEDKNLAYTREDDVSKEDTPYDPTETAEEGKRWLKSQGISEDNIDRAVHLLMAQKLTPRMLEKLKSVSA